MEITDNSCQISRTNRLKKFLNYWQTRDLGLKNGRLITILSVAIFFDRAIYPQELKRAEDILHNQIRDSHLVGLLLDRIKLNLEEYVYDYERYLRDRKKAFDFIKDDIQLYGSMREIFESEGNLSDEEIMAEDIVRDRFDKSYKLDIDNENLFKTNKREWK